MMTCGLGVMHLMTGDRAASKIASKSTFVPPHGGASASSCLLALIHGGLQLTSDTLRARRACQSDCESVFRVKPTFTAWLTVHLVVGGH